MSEQEWELEKEQIRRTAYRMGAVIAGMLLAGVGLIVFACIAYIAMTIFAAGLWR